MIVLVKNEWKKIFPPVLMTTLILAIAMSVLSCTVYQNYSLQYDLEAWEVGTALFSLLYPLFVVIPLCWNLYYERKNNFLLYVMPRVNIKKYLAAKWIAYGLGTLCIIVIPYILSAVFALYVKAPVVPDSGNPFRHIFQNAFIESPLLYAVAFSFWRGMISLLIMTFGQLFTSPLQAFAAFAIYQFIGSWMIFGICMWIRHFAGRKWSVRIVVVLYILSAVWIKFPAIQNTPLTGFNHLLILHHNLGVSHRFEITAFTLSLIVLIIAISTRFAWQGQLPHIALSHRGIAGYYLHALMTPGNLFVLLGVVLGVSIYKGLSSSTSSDLEWIYTLFAGHGTGYFQVLPFLELLITSGAPLYLLAAFVEQSVNGQSLFVSMRGKRCRHLMQGILSASIKFLVVYALLWLMAGLVGAFLACSGLTIMSFRLLLYAVFMKCLDIFVQYLIMLSIYIATRQITIGFLVTVTGNLLCPLPGNWVTYLPFGLSSLTRISVVEPGIGISAVSAFGIEAGILTLMIAGILMWGYKKILN